MSSESETSQDSVHATPTEGLVQDITKDPNLGLLKDSPTKNTPENTEHHHIEYRRYVNDEYLLMVEHESGWLAESDGRRRNAWFYSLLAEKYCSAVPRKNLATAAPVTFAQQGGTYPEITLFPVKWSKEEGTVAEMLTKFKEQHTALEGNHHLDADGKEANILRAIVNWHMGATSHSGIGTHGPALPPRATTLSAIKPLSFGNPVASGVSIWASAGTIADTTPIDIFILDTIPLPEYIKWAWDKWGTSQHLSRYRRILELLGSRSSTHDPYVTETATYVYADAGSFDDLEEVIMVNGRPCAYPHHVVLIDPQHPAAQEHHTECETEADYKQFDTADHGLFIAGIVHDLMPDANIYLIQVLNKYGVGSFLSLAAGFQKVAALRQAGHKAIINCSFVLSFPTDSELAYAKTPSASVDTLFQDLSNLNTVAGGIDPLVSDSIELLRAIGASAQPKPSEGPEGRALIVAAVGNDSTAGNQIDTRYPAALNEDYVVGVGALRTETGGVAEATYSNKVPANGLRALGGEYTAGANEGIVSIYTGEFAGAAAGTQGFVEWAGTSFATPIVASSVAAVCREQRDTPLNAIQKVRAAAIGVVKRVPVFR